MCMACLNARPMPIDCTVLQALVTILSDSGTVVAGGLPSDVQHPGHGGR